MRKTAMMRRSSLLFAILLTLLLGACGFQLRGTYTFPFDSIFINLPDNNPFNIQLKQAITLGTGTRIAATQKDAKVILQIVSDQSAKNILSLSGAGRAQEYQLVRTVSFRVVDAKGRDWVKVGKIDLHRDMTYADVQVLSKESEEAQLWNDMQKDLIQQMLRRMAVAKPQADDSAY
jgi:LPS-assembly lipoprotein